MTLDTVAGRALALVERGFSYRRIAVMLGISKSSVGAYVAGEYGGDEYFVKREHLRGLELARLDRITKRLSRALNSPDDEVAIKAASGLIAASKRRADMQGLDAPKKVEVVDLAKMSREELLQRAKELVTKAEQSSERVH